MESNNLKKIINDIQERVNVNLVSLLDGEKFSIFETEFGKNFENNCKDLFSFIIVAYSMQLLTSLRKVYEEYIFSEDFFRKAEEQIDFELGGKKKKDALKALSLLRIINQMGTSETKNTNENDLFSQEALQELNIVSRLIAYFVLTLYAYVDVFIEESYCYICEKASREKLTSIIEEFQKSKRIIEKLKSLISSMDKNLPEYISESYKQLSNCDDKATLAYTLKLRNDIAHANPIPEIDILKKDFTQQWCNAQKTSKKIKEDFFANLPEPKTELERDMLEGADKLLKKFDSLFLIIEIGFSCMKYLALFEKLLTFFYK